MATRDASHGSYDIASGTHLNISSIGISWQPLVDPRGVYFVLFARAVSLALWQSWVCLSDSQATLNDMDKSASTKQQLNTIQIEELDMMTSSNGNIFRVTGPLWGESTGHRWIPLTKTSDAELWCLFWICAWTNGWTNNRNACDLRRHRAHYDVIVMIPGI